MSVFTNNEYKNHIIEVYNSNLKNKLEEVSIEIHKLLEQVLNKKVTEDKYSLIHHNSGYLGKYYKIVTRVKNGDSLGEKLVNKDALLEIKEKIKSGNHDAIIEELNIRYTDLIGVKILGDLNVDVKSILQLIKDNKHRFRDNINEYFIIFENIERQPDKMANGKEIIKIDSVYHRNGVQYKFELQIKSQLVSAWGDMEHQHFYKNNRFSSLRKSQEPIMKDVGGLLEQIDNLLLSIRSTEKVYSEKSFYWEFRQDIQEKFSDRLFDLFGLSVDATISDISNSLILLYEVVRPNVDNFNFDLELLEDIEGGKYTFENSLDSYVNNFIKYRNVKFRIRVIEAIMLVWYASKTSIDSSKQIYFGFIKWYCGCLLETIQRLYKTHDSIIPFNPIFYKVIKNIDSEECFLDLEIYEEIANYYKFTKDAYIEWKAEVDDEDVFSLETFYTINYLFAESHILGNDIEDIRVDLKTGVSYVILSEYFEYLLGDVKGTVNEKYINITEKIHRILRRG